MTEWEMEMWQMKTCYFDSVEMRDRNKNSADILTHTDAQFYCAVYLVTSHCIKPWYKGMFVSWLLVWKELILFPCSLVHLHHYSLSAPFCLPLTSCLSKQFLCALQIIRLQYVKKIQFSSFNPETNLFRSLCDFPDSSFGLSHRVFACVWLIFWFY